MAKNYIVKSAAATQYTEALNIGQAEIETMPGLRGDGCGCILGVQVRSKQKLAWRVELLDKDGFVIASHDFADTEGIQVTVDGDTLYNYYEFVDGWPIPATAPNVTVSVALRNMSNTAKTAGAAGAAVVAMTIVKG